MLSFILLLKGVFSAMYMHVLADSNNLLSWCCRSKSPKPAPPLDLASVDLSELMGRIRHYVLVNWIRVSENISQPYMWGECILVRRTCLLQAQTST